MKPSCCMSVYIEGKISVPNTEEISRTTHTYTYRSVMTTTSLTWMKSQQRQLMLLHQIGTTPWDICIWSSLLSIVLQHTAYMMMAWHGNAFCITCPLWGIYQWITPWMFPWLQHKQAVPINGDNIPRSDHYPPHPEISNKGFYFAVVCYTGGDSLGKWG